MSLPFWDSRFTNQKNITINYTKYKCFKIYLQNTVTGSLVDKQAVCILAQERDFF